MNSKVLTILKEKLKLTILKEKIINLKKVQKENNLSENDKEYLNRLKNPLNIYTEISNLNEKIKILKTNPICDTEKLNIINCQLNALKKHCDYFSGTLHGTSNFLFFYGEKLLLIKKEINSIEEEIKNLSNKIIIFPKKLKKQQYNNF